MSLTQCGSNLFIDPTNVALVELDDDNGKVVISLKTPIYSEYGEISSRVSTDWNIDEVVRALG